MTQLTLNRFHSMRADMLDARDRIGELEEGIEAARAQYAYLPPHLLAQKLDAQYQALHKARETAKQTADVYAQNLASGKSLESAQRASEMIAEREKKLKKLQMEQAAMLEAKARADRFVSWVAAGGTAKNFEASWPGMWSKELEERSKVPTL